MKPRLAITLGDINGIGPEVLIKALTRAQLWKDCAPVVLGSASVLEQTCAQLENLNALPDSAACVFRLVDALDEDTGRGGPSVGVAVYEAGLTTPERRPGELHAEAGRCAVEWLKAAIRLTLDGAFDGIVTCPLNKKGIHLAGYEYPGHTEILAEMTNSPDFCMSLFAEHMRIVHVTAHCPLDQVRGKMTTDRIKQCICIGDDALGRLQQSGVELRAGRRIAVAGLNPHAGEDGVLGSEEADIILPAIAACREAGMDCLGPYPPDTVFKRMFDGEFDLVVAMYHDQGHIALKLVAMDEGVNVTLGIPIIRTSVDHGTAYDIAGTGAAREGSLLAAVRLAARLAAPGNGGVKGC